MAIAPRLVALGTAPAKIETALVAVTWLRATLVMPRCGCQRKYHLVMTNIAMGNPNHKWRFIAGKIIYKWAIFHGYVK